MIMEMMKILYGLVEAAHYWYKHLKGTFDASNYKTSKNDKCVLIKREVNDVAYCATTVE